MYEDTNARTQEFALEIGLPREIVRIFTSRIPKEINKVGRNGKEYTKDGDTIIFSTLNDIYNMQSYLSSSEVRMNEIRSKYSALVEKVKDNPKATDINLSSFERFAVKETLGPYMKKINIDELTPEEIVILFQWINF